MVEHHYGFRNLGDMTKITEEMIDGSPVDLLVGGTPCQSFSVAGLRGGLADPRGNLALRFVQLAAVMQPRWIVWENVPGVLSSGKGRDFGTFLGALGELGYGFAYRVLDAQWFGVAQRRRRVFVVGYLGDWRRAAAVLFERESVFGNPPTRGKAWEGVARSTAASLTSSGRGVERCGESRGQDDVELAFGGNRTSGPLDVATPCLANGSPHGRQDFASETFVTCFHPTQDPISSEDGLTHALGTGSSGGCASAEVAFTKIKRAQSVTDDESWVPGEVSPTMRCFDQGDTRARTVVAVDLQNVTAGGDLAGTLDTTRPSRGGGQAVAFKPSHYTRGKDGAPSEVAAPLSADADKGDQDTVVAQGFTYSGYSNQPAWMTGDRTDCLPASGHSDGSHQGVGVVAFTTEQTPKFKEDCALTMTKQSPSGGGQPQCVAFKESQSGCRVGSVHATLDANKGSRRMEGVMMPMAVRRLTPRECERLQGFPDDYTLVTYRGKPACDGPRYRALGNSMAVPVMRWIGERIRMVDTWR